MLRSLPYGEFNPLAPEPIPGIFAQNLYANPVIIEAPVELVWQIMIDFESYPTWNPLNRHFSLDTCAKPGEMVTFGPSWGPYDGDELPRVDLTQHERLTVWEENCCLAYASMSIVLQAERVQYISPVSGGATRYQTYERMSGLIAPVVHTFYAQRVIAGFAANGSALKQRAESTVA